MLVICAALLATALAWGNDRPTAMTWVWRIGGGLVAVGALAMFLIVHFQKDEVPDYLHQRFGTFFECNGFCFMGQTIEYEQTCLLEMYFQNQQDVPSQASISLAPARGFFLTRSDTGKIRMDIECAPGAFGVARLKIPVPLQFQGTEQAFEVGASVTYPEGKGKTIRFRDGIVVRSNADLFNAVGTALTIGGAMTGQLILTKPVTLTLTFPKNVAADIPWNMNPEAKAWDKAPAETKAKVITLWKLFDPPLP